MNKFNLVLALTFLVSDIEKSNALMSLGRCPRDIPYITNFDPARYAGKWYEILRDPGNPMTIATDCVTKEFSLDSNGNLDLYFRGYYHLFFSS